MLGGPRDETGFDFYRHVHLPSNVVVGAHVTSHPPVETPTNQWIEVRHAELSFDYLEEGRMDVGALVSHRVRYTDAPDLYRELLDERTQTMGVVLDWTR